MSNLSTQIYGVSDNIVESKHVRFDCKNVYNEQTYKKHGFQ